MVDSLWRGIVYKQLQVETLSLPHSKDHLNKYSITRIGPSQSDALYLFSYDTP